MVTKLPLWMQLIIRYQNWRNWRRSCGFGFRDKYAVMVDGSERVRMIDSRKSKLHSMRAARRRKAEYETLHPDWEFTIERRRK